MQVETAKYLTTVWVLDADHNTVEVAIYQDMKSNAVFGIDASYVEQVEPETVPCLFGNDYVLTLEDD